MIADRDLDISQPYTKEDLDIPFSVVQDLLLRRTMADDLVTTTSLSRDLGLSRRIVEAAFDNLRDRKALDVRTMQGNDYVFSLTAFGKEMCRDAERRSRYNGIAPVAIETYQTAVAVQRAQIKVNRRDMSEAMKDLVVASEMLDQLGPAFNSQHTIFFYGPAGTGKTSLAERLVRLYGDWIVVPHAILVDSQFVVVLDPTVHEPLPVQPDGLDPRWVACRRPLVTVGGELDASMLELQFDPAGRVYQAPLQVKANNGMMLIDDFGRQVLTPRQLLNRWIYPLAKRRDYLTLSNGHKFAMPFELMVAFSTNLDPNDLGDEAFFRRIQNKVYVGPMTPPMFDRILMNCVRASGVRLQPNSFELLRETCLERDAVGLRANYPGDFCRMIGSIAEYEESMPVLDERMLAMASDLYWGAVNTSNDIQRSGLDQRSAPAGASAGGPSVSAEDDDIEQLVHPLVPRSIAPHPTHSPQHHPHHEVSTVSPPLLPKRIPQSGTIAATGMRPSAVPAERD